jgi:hypothetical protein
LVYISIIEPIGRVRPFGENEGESRGWTGEIVVNNVGDFGCGRRLKDVVFPLNALMLTVNFAQGEDSVKPERVDGFKDILCYNDR